MKLSQYSVSLWFVKKLAVMLVIANDLLTKLLSILSLLCLPLNSTLSDEPGLRRQIHVSAASGQSFS